MFLKDFTRPKCYFTYRSYFVTVGRSSDIELVPANKPTLLLAMRCQVLVSLWRKQLTTQCVVHVMRRLAYGLFVRLLLQRFQFPKINQRLCFSHRPFFCPRFLYCLTDTITDHFSKTCCGGFPPCHLSRTHEFITHMICTIQPMAS